MRHIFFFAWYGYLGSPKRHQGVWELKGFGHLRGSKARAKGLPSTRKIETTEVRFVRGYKVKNRS